MSTQDSPLERISLQNTNRLASWFHHSADLFDIDPPYQRASLWIPEQRRNLIKSFLMGLPVPAIVLNRHDTVYGWTGDTEYPYAVVDGKQRIETIRAWFRGELAVPATWFAPEHVATTIEGTDGLYTSCDGLTKAGQRVTENRFSVPVVEASVPTVAAEAVLYLLLNGAGTSQTEDDLAHAAAVAGTQP